MKKNIIIILSLLLICMVSPLQMHGQSKNNAKVVKAPITAQVVDVNGNFIQGVKVFANEGADETVTNAFVKTKRFNIVDRSKMDALTKEKNLQKTEDFIDGTVIEQGISLGAKNLISGHVISSKAEQMRTDDGTVTYKAKLSISLKVIDVATGQVITSDIIGTERQGSVQTPGVAYVRIIAGRAKIGDSVDMVSDGTYWYANGYCGLYDAIQFIEQSASPSTSPSVSPSRSPSVSVSISPSES
jgi:curli biogenesis system outer membrane secretion channel CsgG